MKKFWNRKRIHINLYILIPLIYSGISIIAVVVTYQLACNQGEADAVGSVLKWGAFIGAFSFVCSLVILWLVMNPVMKFVRRTESLPLFPRAGADEEKSSLQRDRLEEMTEVLDQVTDILGKVEAREFFPRVVGQSRRMREIFAQLLKIAPTDSTVMILGESGTGKELIARAIHRISKRNGQRFVAVNAGSFANELFASEFFGYNQGAFTGAISNKRGFLEEADKGTLFLDEIGELALPIQVKLLRVLQEGEFFRLGSTRNLKVDVRIIAATNKNLHEEMKQGNFRKDLFYRLNINSVYLPPLRERTGDIPILSYHFLRIFCQTNNKKIEKISDSAMKCLTQYDYPGNIRELMNIINSAVIVESSNELKKKSLPNYFFENEGFGDGGSTDVPLKTLKEIEDEHIRRILDYTGGNKTRAAQILGISRISLISKTKKRTED